MHQASTVGFLARLGAGASAWCGAVRVTGLEGARFLLADRESRVQKTLRRRRKWTRLGLNGFWGLEGWFSEQDPPGPGFEVELHSTGMAGS